MVHIRPVSDVLCLGMVQKGGFCNIARQECIKKDRTLLAKSPGLPRRATMGCDNPPLPKRSCSFVAVSAMNEQAIDFANSVPPFLHHSSAGTVADFRYV